MTSITQALEVTYADQSVYLTQRPDGAWEVQDFTEERLLLIDSQLPLKEVIEEAEAEAAKLRLQALKQERQQIDEHIADLQEAIEHKTGLKPDPEADAAHREAAMEAREQIKGCADRYIEFDDGKLLAENSFGRRRGWRLYDREGKPITNRLEAEANNLPNLLQHVGDNPDGDGCIAVESSYVTYRNGTFQGYDFFATVGGVYPEKNGFVESLKR